MENGIRHNERIVLAKRVNNCEILGEVVPKESRQGLEFSTGLGRQLHREYLWCSSTKPQLHKG